MRMRARVEVKLDDWLLQETTPPSEIHAVAWVEAREILAFGVYAQERRERVLAAENLATNHR